MMDLNGQERGRRMQIPPSLVEVYGSRIGPYGISVYVCLASQVDATGQAALSLGQLQRLSGMSRRSIVRGIMALIEHGLVTRQSRLADHGGKETNAYRLMLASASHETPGALGDYPGALGDYPGALGDYHLKGNGSEICPLVPPVPDPNAFVDPKILGDPKEKTPPLPPSGGPRARARRTIPTDLPGFDDWWNIYTPSRRHAKPKCLTLWVRDGLEARAEEIITHTMAMQATEQWQDETLIPHALKYLSEQRYTAPPPKPAIRSAAYGMTYTQEETDRWIDEEEKWRATL